MDVREMLNHTNVLVDAIENANTDPKHTAHDTEGD